MASKSPKEIFDNIMMRNLEVEASELPGLKYRGIEKWDSMAHMDIVQELEEAFRIRMENLDILRFSSYEKGIEILAEYGVDISL